MVAQTQGDVGAGRRVLDRRGDVDGEEGGVVRPRGTRGVVFHETDRGAADIVGAVLRAVSGAAGRGRRGEDGGEGGDGGEVEDAAGLDCGVVDGRDPQRGARRCRRVGEDVLGSAGRDGSGEGDQEEREDGREVHLAGLGRSDRGGRAVTSRR